MRDNGSPQSAGWAATQLAKLNNNKLNDNNEPTSAAGHDSDESA